MDKKENNNNNMISKKFFLFGFLGVGIISLVFLLSFVSENISTGLFGNENQSDSMRKTAGKSNFSKLTDGQQKKWLFIESINITSQKDHVEISSELLPEVCQQKLFLKLEFIADEVATDGDQTTLTIALDCSKSEKNAGAESSPKSYQLKISDIRKTKSVEKFKTENFELEGAGFSAFTPFPNNWTLKSISISGKYNFTVNSNEIDLVRKSPITFSLQ